MNILKETAKILICEDEVLIADDLAGRLRALGYSVCAKTSSAEKALELVEELRPDLVMMDIMLKGVMDGIEAAEIIKNKWGAPVVFLTAYADTERLERAKPTCPFGYILKPFQNRDLEVTTEMALYTARVDIEKRAATEALEISEKKYRLLADNAVDVIFTLNLDFIFTYVSPSIFRLTNYNDREVMGESISKILSPASFETASETLAEELRVEGDEGTAAERTRILDLEMIKKDESQVWTEVKCSFLRNEFGAAVGITGVARDISERKRAEDALKASEEKYRMLVESTGDMVFVHDENGVIKFVNQKGLLFTGYRYEDVIGANILDYIPEEEWETIFERKKRRVSGESGNFNYETAFVNRNGVRIDVDVHTNPLFINNEFLGELVVARDITDRRLAEAEKERLQSQLRQSQKMEAVGTLAGGVAHDFNNLLQAIRGYIQLVMLDKNEQHSDFKNLKAADNTCSRAAELIRQLLLFSRKAETERRPIDLNRELGEAVRILKRTIPRMIEIKCYQENKLWTVNADPVQMQQIFLNLGNNAADAMPDGGRLVFETSNIVLDDEFASGHLGSEPGGYVLITVSDTGAGMDNDTVEKIFEPFYTTKAIGKGTGLGLASVYGIVKSHGGYITCYSEKEQGTIFKIYLPASEQPAVDDTRINAESGKSVIGNETILLVDDEAPIRDLTSQFLLKFGYTPIVAASGEDALQLYENNREKIDLVILDLGMPGMGGHKCLQHLIQLEPELKVLIASGYSVKSQAAKSLKAGAKGFVGKPYQLDELLIKVREILDE